MSMASPMSFNTKAYSRDIGADLGDCILSQHQSSSRPESPSQRNWNLPLDADSNRHDFETQPSPFAEYPTKKFLFSEPSPSPISEYPSKKFDPTQPGPISDYPSKKVDFDRVAALRQTMNEEEKDKADIKNKLLLIPKGPSLAVRERSFRTNLQARALALSRNRSAAANLGSARFSSGAKLIASDPKIEKISEGKIDEASQCTNDTASGERKREESLSDFSARLEQSIRVMKTTDIVLDAAGQQQESKTSTIFQNGTLLALTTEKEPMSSRFEKSIPLMKSISSETGPLAIAPYTTPQTPAKEGPSTALSPTKSPIEKQENDVEPPETPAEKHSSRQATPATQKQTLPSLQEVKADIKFEQASGRDASKNTPVALGSRACSKPTPRCGSTPTHLRSFHVDGWKESDLAGNALTEESIAARELKARETYIKAMQTHQALIKTGKGESSPEVMESQKSLQVCYAKIEYWERLKDDYIANPSAYSPDALQSVTYNCDHQALPVTNSQLSFRLSRDLDFAEAQELKAREAYIKAMRDHQELIVKRVRQDSSAWAESQRRQKECLVKLQYWEAKTNGLETSIDEGPSGGEGQPDKRDVYKVSLENKGDRSNSDSILDTVAKSVHDTVTRGVHATFYGRNDGPPRVVVPNNESDISQLDGDAYNAEASSCHAFESFFAFLCTAPKIARKNKSHRSHGDSESKTSKKRQKSVPRKGNKKVRRKVPESMSRQGYGSDGEANGGNGAAKNKPMNEIENQAKEILQFLSNDSAFSNDDDEDRPIPAGSAKERRHQLQTHLETDEEDTLTDEYADEIDYFMDKEGGVNMFCGY